MTSPSSFMMLKNFVGGEWRESRGRRVPDFNPADATEVVAEAPASTAEEAAEAVKKFNGQDVDGRTLKVELANPSGSGGGRSGGGYRSGGGGGGGNRGGGGGGRW